MAWSAHPSSRKATLPANWYSEVRPFVLRRDGRICQLRWPRCIGHATDADHIGDRDDHRPENLQAACQPCHRAKSALQGAAASTTARRARIAARKRPQERHPGVLD